MTTPAGAFTHFTAKYKRWQEALFAGGIFLVLTLVFFWPQLIQGRSLYWGDIGLYFYPMLQFLHENLQRGRLPLWNPEILCGTPYAGNPQTWPLYPASSLLRWLSPSAFINITVAGHVWFAGLGMFFFLRRTLFASRAAATFGGIVFMFGGQLISKEQFPNMVQAISYLPWILLFLDRLTASGRRREAVYLGIALGLQILAAHAQITWLTLYLALFFFLRRCRELRPNSRFFLRTAVSLLIAGAIAAGLSCGQLLPSIALYETAARHRLAFHVINRFYLPYNQLGNFLLPTCHGHPYWGNFRARGNFWETCCYLGVIPCAASLAGIVSALRRGAAPAARFWLLVFVIGVWLSLGGGGGLYRAVYWTLPGFRNFHDPARCLLLAAFAAAALSAAGLDFVLVKFPEAHRRRAGVLLVLLLTFLDLLHFGRTLYPLSAAFPSARRLPVLAAVAADPLLQSGQARFLSPDSARIWESFTTHKDYRRTVPGYQALWMDTLCSNLMMTQHLDDAYGYEPITERRLQTIAGTAVNNLRPQAAPQEKSAAASWAGLLSVRYIAACRMRAPDAELPGLQPVLADPTLPPANYPADRLSIYLSRNSLWQPRARVVTDFVGAPTSPAALALMTQSLLGRNRLNLFHTTVLTGPAGMTPQPGGAAMPAAATDLDTDHVLVTAATRHPGILVLADTDSPGWFAALDGRPVRILTADYCLRAVALPAPGVHRALYVYRPTPFLLGLYITFLTVCVLAGLFAWEKSRI